MHWIIPFEIIDFNILLCIIFMHHIIRSGFSGSAGCIESGVICMMRSCWAFLERFRDSRICRCKFRRTMNTDKHVFPPEGPFRQTCNEALLLSIKHLNEYLVVWWFDFTFDSFTAGTCSAADGEMADKCCFFGSCEMDFSDDVHEWVMCFTAWDTVRRVEIHHSRALSVILKWSDTKGIFSLNLKLE